MKYYELNKDEKRLLKDFEQGKLKRVRNFSQKSKELQKAARLTLDKTKNINIRISEGDLQKMKALASEKGVPYQTLVSSLIHQYSVEKAREII